MPPGETAKWYVLLELVETQDEAGEQLVTPVVTFERIGALTVPKGTQRSTVLRKAINGDLAIPLNPGETGTVHAIPAGELQEGVAVRARQTLVFDLVDCESS